MMFSKQQKPFGDSDLPVNKSRTEKNGGDAAETQQ
jgi:hypothetical protein